MNTHSSSTPSNSTALVLGGGGSAGNAWLIGVIAGLFDAGLDVTLADLIVGTSAGATAAVQISGSRPDRLLADILAAPVPQGGRPGTGTGAGAGAGGVRAPGAPPVDHLARTDKIIAAASDAAEMRRGMGAVSLELEAVSDGSHSERWRAIVASRLPMRDWPDRDIRLTAVDAITGDGVVFDRTSPGVGIADAVAASTSSSLPYRIGDRVYIDGGYRRNENADVAAGYGRVLVLSPFGGRTRHPLEWGMQLSAQVEELRAGGSAVETIFPDEASLAAFGGNMMNLAAREPAARAGFEQGRGRAAELSSFWG